MYTKVNFRETSTVDVVECLHDFSFNEMLSIARISAILRSMTVFMDALCNTPIDSEIHIGRLGYLVSESLCF